MTLTSGSWSELRRASISALLILLTLPAITQSATAASISIVDNQLCEMELQGAIIKQDAIAFAKVLEAARALPPNGKRSSETSVCLNSDGGDFDEAIEIIKLLVIDRNTNTVVAAESRCFSACALIFMFGSHDEGDEMFWQSRRMHLSAQVGFHSPYISPRVDTARPELSAKAYRSGIRAIGRLLEVDEADTFPRALLAEALKRGPDEYLFVDTLRKAAEWGIEVFGAKMPPLTESMMERACLNKARNDRYKYGGRWFGAESETGQRETILAGDRQVEFKNGRVRHVFAGFGSEDDYSCIVDAFRTKNGLKIFVYLAEEPTPEFLTLEEVEAIEGPVEADTPVTFLFDFNTKLGALPR